MAKYNQDWFLGRMKTLFCDRYDFSMSEYKGNRSLIKYRCKACNKVIEPKAMYLLRGCGCRDCSRKTIARKKTLSNCEFVKRAIEVHGDRYDYSMVDYKKNSLPVEIVCSDHGAFLQQPSNHLSGQGCKLCSHWDLLVKARPNDKAILYNLLFIPIDGSEPFIKVGITTKPSWKNRFYGSVNHGFEIKEIQLFTGTVLECSKRERLILDYLSSNNHRYKVRNLKGLKLGGWTECYPVYAHDDMINYVFTMK